MPWQNNHFLPPNIPNPPFPQACRHTMASIILLRRTICPGLFISQAMALPIPPLMRGPNGAFCGCHGDWAFFVIFGMALLFSVLWPYVLAIVADAARAPGPGQAPLIEQLPFGDTFRNALWLFGFPVANSTGRVAPRRPVAARIPVRTRQRSATL